ncbi:MAG: ribose-phosphate diphosphokinase [Acidimicrobiales bacterium]
MALCIVAGTANPNLAEAVAAGMGSVAMRGGLERFPDGELCPVVGPMRGDDVYVVQPTAPPVNEHLMELALLVDACRRAGSERVTAVVPYFGYARQDRRSRPGQAIGVRVAADILVAAGADRIVVVDPHTPGFEATCSIPVEVLTATSVLVAALRDRELGRSVIVAPDLGAVKLAERFGAAAGLPVAMVRKSRLSGTSVRAEELVGDVEGCRPIVVDDMISTGATIEATTRLLEAHGALPGTVVAATHALLLEAAPDRLAQLGLARLLVTDTVRIPSAAPPVLEVCSVATVLSDAIGRLYREEPLDDLGRFE